MGKRPKNNFYAFDNGEERGIVTSWPACEAKVKGRKARYRGFLDRASAQGWLDGDPGAVPPERRKHYAYVNETGQGVVDSWEACEPLVTSRSARYRGFRDRASAEAWLAGGARYEDRQRERDVQLESYPDDAIFFDAGTGRGLGTEIKVVDRAGASLLHFAPETEGEPTKNGTLLLGPGRTNNYGELLACRVALAAAEALGSRHLFGDSKLVLDYWSKNRVTRDKRQSDPELSRLATETARARRAFEAGGGTLDHVPGGINPADLGFHKD